MTDRRDFFENLVYYNVARRRFTQESPVMPDVWIDYGLRPGAQSDLLMVADWHHTPTQLARSLKQRLARDRSNGRVQRFRETDSSPHDVAYNQNSVVARLFFDQLVRAVLPLSRWWLHCVAGVHQPGDPDRLVAGLGDATRLVGVFTDLLSGKSPEHAVTIAPDTLWMARVVGFLALLSTTEHRTAQAESSQEQAVRRLRELLAEHRLVAGALVDLLHGMDAAVFDDPRPLYSVNRNRETTTSLHDSVASVKGDAARRVFNVGGAGIRWAVVDSGIDATHVAFRKRDLSGTPRPEPFAKRARGRRRRGGSAAAQFTNETRVVATYDFVHIRELLSTEPDAVDDLDRSSFPVLRRAPMRRALRELLTGLDSHVIDWERLEPFLEVRHEPIKRGGEGYRPPLNRHGTHVAGIIAAHWRAGDEEAEPPVASTVDDSPLSGVAPSVELYDLRVLDDEGMGNEFAIMSALQFVRALNNRKDFVAIHGVNLSFSIEHDVANYACGRTPVCEEAERLVGSGVTVVAAAGNSGRARYVTPSGRNDDGFRTVSITDPGNATSVITVGATHRRDPHTYGVSYFSSRGPTGDGRLKPDLVAPGEKILSTVPGNGADRLDGTSMAAPHVSGAAALIMARHPELIGQPRRIRDILCDGATDLGRERYFQGAGLLDILRALESI